MAIVQATDFYERFVLVAVFLKLTRDVALYVGKSPA